MDKRPSQMTKLDSKTVATNSKHNARKNTHKISSKEDSNIQSKSVQDAITVRRGTNSVRSKKQIKDKVVAVRVSEPVDLYDDNVSVVENIDSNDDSHADSNISDSKDLKTSKFLSLMESLIDLKRQIYELQKKEKVIIKKLENAHKLDIKRAGTRKRKANPEATGFVLDREVGGELADWLQVPRGTVMSGPAISKTFWKRMKEEGLQYEEDGRVLRTNKTVSKIFGVDPRVNKSTDPKDRTGFNLITHQNYIAYAINNFNS